MTAATTLSPPQPVSRKSHFYSLYIFKCEENEKVKQKTLKQTNKQTKTQPFFVN